jgi:hypothetical protein
MPIEAYLDILAQTFRDDEDRAQVLDDWARGHITDRVFLERMRELKSHAKSVADRSAKAARSTSTTTMYPIAADGVWGWDDFGGGDAA